MLCLFYCIFKLEIFNTLNYLILKTFGERRKPHSFVLSGFGIPIVFYFIKRKKKSLTGIDSLLGEVVEVRRWKETEGRVVIKGEMWKAVSDASFIKGDKAIIQDVKGLTLKVTPIGDISGKTDSKGKSNQ